METGLRYDLTYYTTAGARRAQAGVAEPLPERAGKGEVIQARCINGAPEVVWIGAEGRIARPSWADDTARLRRALDEAQREVRIDVEGGTAIRVRIEAVDRDSVRVWIDGEPRTYRRAEFRVPEGTDGVRAAWAQIWQRARRVLAAYADLAEWQGRKERGEA